MNKKLFKILMFSFAGFSFVILLALLILSLMLKWSMWTFGVPGIIMGSAWIVFGFIFLIKKLSISNKEKPKIAVKEAIEKVKIMIRDDIENGDNLIIDRKITEHRGKTLPKTPVLIILGRGSEKKQRRAIIVNLNNMEEEITDLIDPTIEEIIEQTRLIAEDPEDKLITEKIVPMMSALGYQNALERKNVPGSQGDRDEENKKTAEGKAGV